MSTYETRPGGAAGVPRAAPQSRSRRDQIIAEARARGDEVIEHPDGRLEVRKAKSKGRTR
jgi:hypothetical protein